MKRYLLIIVALLAAGHVFAVQQNSMLIGGQLGVRTTNNYYSGTPFRREIVTIVELYPQWSMFLTENISVDLNVGYHLRKAKVSFEARTSLAAGGRFFYKNLYGGLELSRDSAWQDVFNPGHTQKYSASYLVPKVGYLAPIKPNIYADLQSYYKMGIGEYSGDRDGDNRERNFGLRLGILVQLNNKE